MIKRFTAIILLTFLLVSFSVCAFADTQEKEYDPQFTMQALNMAIVSVHTITSAGNKLVLTQEYDKIKDKLMLGNIKSDPSIMKIYSELMNTITEQTITLEKKKYILNKFKKREQRLLVNTFSGFTRVYGADRWSFLGSLAVTCISQYFSYRNDKGILEEQSDDEQWNLEEKEIRYFNSLQVELLNASWNLLDQYSLPDEYRLTQDSLDEFYKAISTDDIEKRLRILKRKESSFLVYPPYWMYRAVAAEECGDNEEAKKSYDKFDEVWRPVLRKDPYKQVVIKHRIIELSKAEQIDREKMLSNLKELRDYTYDDDWANNLFIGMAYYALGEKDIALDSVLANTDSEYEIEISSKLYKQMKRDSIDLSNLGCELKEIFENTHKNNNTGKTIAVIGNTIITDADFANELDAFKEVARPQAIAQLATQAGQKDFLRQLVEVRMFEEKAKQEKLDKSTEFKSLFREQMKAVLAIAHLKKLLDAVTVDNDMIKAEYNSNAKKYIDDSTKKIKPLNMVSDEIKKELTGLKQQEVYKNEIDKLKKELSFKLDDKALELLRKVTLTDAEKDTVLATFSDKKVTVGEVYKEIEQKVPFSVRPKILDGDGLKDFLDQIWAYDLSIAAAEKNYDELVVENVKLVSDTKRRVLVKFLYDKILEPVKVDDKEVKEYYDKNLAEFAVPAQTKAHHILVEDEATAKKLLEDIKKGLSKFEDVAKTYSMCPSGNQGGDLGEFTEGQMVPEFEKACKDAKVNKVVGPVKTEFGYHIIRVDSRSEARTMKFEEVKDGISSNLLPQKQKEALDKYREALMKEYNVKIYPENLE